jgi:hypothetical protein
MKLYIKYDKDPVDVPMVDRILRGIGRFVQGSFKKSIVLETKPYPNESKELWYLSLPSLLLIFLVNYFLPEIFLIFEYFF